MMETPCIPRRTGPSARMAAQVACEPAPASAEARAQPHGAPVLKHDCDWLGRAAPAERMTHRRSATRPAVGTQPPGLRTRSMAVWTHSSTAIASATQLEAPEPGRSCPDWRT